MNPVDDITRQKVNTYEGKTPALADAQVRHWIGEQKEQSLNAKRDRATLSIHFNYDVGRNELCQLRVRDILERRCRVRLTLSLSHQSSPIPLPFLAGRRRERLSTRLARRLLRGELPGLDDDSPTHRCCKFAPC